jgi:hypothetical protein
MLTWTLTGLVDMDVDMADGVDTENPCFPGPI